MRSGRGGRNVYSREWGARTENAEEKKKKGRLVPSGPPPLPLRRNYIYPVRYWYPPLDHSRLDLELSTKSGGLIAGHVVQCEKDGVKGQKDKLEW